MTFSDTLNNLNSGSQILLICWGIFLAACMFVYVKKPALTPYFLFLAAVCIAGAFALFAPYLHLWDEQFHALVGKNLAKEPFTPKLIPLNPVESDQSLWSNGTIWLHKQPLFTWQMALSIKLFGANAFAVRLPSVLFHGVLVVTIFRIGTIIFDKRAGLIAALITMHSAYLLGLISGRIGTDHNDFIFLCYIILSFWAWFEWRSTATNKWLYWIGIFAGCAILTKWLVGLLVFAGWGAVILPELIKGNFRKPIKPVLVSFSVALLVSMPWQIYCFFRFPADFKKEMNYNSHHVSQAVENHSGGVWYHFERLSDLYFPRVDFLIVFLISLTLLLLSKKVKREYKTYLLVSIFIVYLFFTLVQTKMPSFTLPAFGCIVLIIAFGISEIAQFIKQQWLQKTIATVLSVLMINWMLKPSPTLNNYTVKTDPGKTMITCYRFMKEQGESSTKRIVFGVNFFPQAHISWMFFNDEIAYPFIPTKSEIKKAQSKGYSVVLVQTHESDSIADLSPGVEILRFK